MNLFVIPSWYPHSCYPLEGRYVGEQATAIAELSPGTTVHLCLWAQGLGLLTPAHLRHSPGCAWKFIVRRRHSVHQAAPGVLEHERPAPQWSHRVLGGNRRGLLASCSRTLDEVTRSHGRPDLLHAHVSYPAGWIAEHLSRRTGIPYVITEHMGPFPLPVYSRPNGGLIPEIRQPLVHAAATIAVSPSLADRMESFGLTRPEVIPNLVDERLYPIANASGSDTFTFFTLCGMERTKGIDDLIAAIARLVPQLAENDRARLRFRIGGDGPELERLRARADEAGISRYLTWLGLLTREQARREFGLCSAFVLPSHHESFGIVFVEAMASGKPSVGTRSGGPEWILTPEDGLLVEPRRPDQLAAALKTLYQEHARFDGRAIRRRFLERFSRKAVVSSLVALYERVKSGAAAAPPRGSA